MRDELVSQCFSLSASRVSALQVRSRSIFAAWPHMPALEEDLAISCLLQLGA